MAVLPNRRYHLVLASYAISGQLHAPNWRYWPKSIWIIQKDKNASFVVFNQKMFNLQNHKFSSSFSPDFSWKNRKLGFDSLISFKKAKK